MLAALVFAIVQESPPHVETKAEVTTPDAEARALLDELIERSRAIKSFSAKLLMTQGDEAPPTSVRIDYLAPDVIRLDMVEGEDSSSVWCRGSIFCLRARGDGERLHARFSIDEINAQLHPIEDLLDRYYPTSMRFSSAMSASITIRAKYDEVSEEGTFDISCAVAPGIPTPFGWLEVLRDQTGRALVDGDQLRFTSDDGSVKVAVARSNGFLEKLEARSAEENLTITLESLELDQELEPGRLDLPTDAPEGTDVAATLLVSIRSSCIEKFRSMVYERVSAALSPGPIESDTRARVVEVFGRLMELDLSPRLEPWITKTKSWNDQQSDYLLSLHEKGKTEAMIEAWRTDARRSLDNRIDDVLSSIATVPIPTDRRPGEHDPELLALERAALTRLFNKHCRVPLLADFDKKTSNN